MNCGLGNLDTIKRYVQQAALVADASFDEVLATIGKGAAEALNKYCNRDFARGVAVKDEFTADRAFWVLRRYPVETIATVEQRDTYGAGWDALTVNDLLVNLANDRGLMEFGSRLGPIESRVRVTYTGGYWFKTAEPEDTGYSADTLPVGATTLPGDVQLAWLVQVNAWFLKRDKMNLISAAGAVPEAAQLVAALAGRDMEPEVKTMMKGHTRYV